MSRTEEFAALRRHLVSRVLDGPGSTPAQLRAGAFGNTVATEPLGRFIMLVADNSAQLTDADFATLSAAGYTDDQLFEIVVCAALGAANRQYDAARAALAAALGDEGADDASR
ncbi:carboxymuconolactone decarboxylase family protein [Nocardia stercoris]|uniref:Carboxymuconolactone decarboxylase family protein n=1 Tax=Nocardia stercoris TaxID=2483361 RepID=A0A3M2KTC7_9NOCA|nr:hypothetical protein [Nocardia stercoris]RMI28341.1 hypothetical protein EBN03_30275 [Nocardia stercoris]